MRLPFTKKLYEQIAFQEEYSEALRSYNEELIDRLENLREENLGLSDSIYQITASKEKYVEDLEAKIAEQGELIEKLSTDENASVTLMFDNGNYEIVTPIIKTTDESFENLFNLRVMSDDQEGNMNAIRLSLLNLAREALEQICEDFTGDIE